MKVKITSIPETVDITLSRWDKLYIATHKDKKRAKKQIIDNHIYHALEQEWKWTIIEEDTDV